MRFTSTDRSSTFNWHWLQLHCCTELRILIEFHWKCTNAIIVIVVSSTNDKTSTARSIVVDEVNCVKCSLLKYAPKLHYRQDHQHVISIEFTRNQIAVDVICSLANELLTHQTTHDIIIIKIVVCVWCANFSSRQSTTSEKVKMCHVGIFLRRRFLPNWIKLRSIELQNGLIFFAVAKNRCWKQ